MSFQIAEMLKLLTLDAQQHANRDIKCDNLVQITHDTSHKRKKPAQSVQLILMLPCC